MLQGKVLVRQIKSKQFGGAGRYALERIVFEFSALVRGRNNAVTRAEHSVGIIKRLRFFTVFAVFFDFSIHSQKSVPFRYAVV